MERMSTISTYDQDASAMGRINAWMMAWNLAVDRFPIGGGFAAWAPDVYQLYAPDPTRVLVAHSRGTWPEQIETDLLDTSCAPQLAAQVHDCYLCVTEIYLYAGQPYERITAFARELVRTAIDTVVDRMRGMVMAVEPAELRWRASLSVHGLEELPVWFTPTGERDQRGERPEESRPEPVVTRWVRRRKRRPAAGQGARYQAPLPRNSQSESGASASEASAPAAPARTAP